MRLVLVKMWGEGGEKEKQMCLMNRNRISETVAFSLRRGPEERERAYKAVFSRPEKGSQSLWEARGQAFGERAPPLS